MGKNRNKKNSRSSSMWGFLVRELVKAGIWIAKKAIWLLVMYLLKGE